MVTLQNHCGLEAFSGDYENRLVTANVPANAGGIQGAHSYTYDALGRRVTKTVNGATTIFVSDGLQEVSEYAAGAAANSPTRSFVYGSYIDEVLMMVNHAGASAGKYYYIQNNVYSVGALMNQAGGIVEFYTYTPYGQIFFVNKTQDQLLSGSTVGQPFNFTGRRYDPETGLHYYRARYYSADLGRFIGRDPITYAGSQWNLYGYVNANPAKLTDPLGLTPSLDKLISFEAFLQKVKQFDALTSGYYGGNRAPISLPAGPIGWRTTRSTCHSGRVRGTRQQLQPTNMLTFDTLVRRRSGQVGLSREYV